MDENFMANGHDHAFCAVPMSDLNRNIHLSMKLTRSINMS